MPLAAGEPAARQRKVTIWPRVQESLGPKVVAVLPWVTPFLAAQRMASA